MSVASCLGRPDPRLLSSKILTHLL